MNCRRGDIVLVLFPDSNLRTFEEHAAQRTPSDRQTAAGSFPVWRRCPRACAALKRRPALVVQADGLGLDLPQTVVAMITSNEGRAGHASRVPVRVASARQ